MKDYFGLTCLFWGFITAHHLWRLWKRKHPGSLTVACYTLGWIANAGREGHWIPLQWAHVPTTMGLVIGGAVSVLILASWVWGWAQK